MGKYYAVRRGRTTGIFTTWDECKKNVTGYSGAEYKSFTSREDAQRFINEGKSEQRTAATVQVFQPERLRHMWTEAII